MSVSKGVRVGPATTDTCPWCGAGIEYHSNCDGPREEWPPEEEARVWLTCPNEDCPVQPSTLVCKTLEEADAAWNTRRPSTTRDAALREEGRVQERARLVRGIRERAKQPVLVGLTGLVQHWLLDVADMIEGGIGQFAEEPATPDASQGSARPGGHVNESAPLPAINEGRGPGPVAPQGSPLPVALALVHEQAEDAGLWFVDPKTAAEAYLQRALRALHAAVEASQGNPPDGRALEGGAWPKDAVETVARAIFAADALHSEGGAVAWDGITADYQEDMRAVALAALAAAATPEGRALEGELAEALRDEHETVRRWLRRIHKCAERCVTCALLARYDASKAIPQSAPTGLVCGHPFADGSFCNQSADNDHGHPRIPQSGTVKEGT